MSYVESHLQAGERILYHADRGHAWYDILWAIVSTFLIAPLVLAFYTFVMSLFLRGIAALLPGGPESQLFMAGLAILMMAVIPLMAVYTQIVDFVAFWQTDLALTDRRLFGRAPGRNRFWVHTIDIPIQDVAHVHRYRLSSLVSVDRKSTRHREIFGPIKALGRFLDECKRWE